MTALLRAKSPTKLHIILCPPFICPFSSWFSLPSTPDRSSRDQRLFRADPHVDVRQRSNNPERAAGMVELLRVEVHFSKTQTGDRQQRHMKGRPAHCSCCYSGYDHTIAQNTRAYDGAILQYNGHITRSARHRRPWTDGSSLREHQ